MVAKAKWAQQPVMPHSNNQCLISGADNQINDDSNDDKIKTMYHIILCLLILIIVLTFIYLASNTTTNH